MWVPARRHAFSIAPASAAPTFSANAGPRPRSAAVMSPASALP